MKVGMKVTLLHNIECALSIASRYFLAMYMENPSQCSLCILLHVSYQTSAYRASGYKNQRQRYLQ